MINKEYNMFGTKNQRIIIEEIIKEMNFNEEDSFDLRLIMSEALTNAFVHGNKGDASKPVCLKFRYDGEIVIIEIKDCGDGMTENLIPEKIADERILSEKGRGFYLISCCSDKISFNDSTVIIEKKVRIY
ncbi:serine-protein kinase RsbW [Oxobacter pfennigii]|uniref:Serine-protein kinase RsbW n=1 Tax=Oxobacter pfennigii TaxID=36849 RepID=A0A0P8X2U1_9CLOT|nr:ATP-binding protein [Oxobacter pfennigii]KPU45115.1 serine-protein kinase RsbW [Oxobacter pfennigii]